MIGDIIEIERARRSVDAAGRTCADDVAVLESAATDRPASLAALLLALLPGLSRPLLAPVRADRSSRKPL